MFSAFANIFKIPDLRKKVLFTLGIITIYRLGTFLPVPGIDVAALQGLLDTLGKGQGIEGDLVAIANLFSGGAISNAAIFGLGVMPYISASIIFQVLTVVVPSLAALAKEGDAGRKKIQQYVRISTVFLSFFQATIICVGLAQFTSPKIVTSTSVTSFAMSGALIITASCMLLMWLGEQIDEYGIGNGISMIIMVGILARFIPGIGEIMSKASLTTIVGSSSSDQLGLVQILAILAVFAIMIMAVVMITRGQRRIPIQQARRTRGTRTYGGQRTYLPIGVNMVNVIPIIFASAIFIVPNALSAVHAKALDGTALYYMTWVFSFFNYNTYWYNVFYVALIIFFAYFYAAITFKPDEVADRMKQYGNFIPGIRPGRQTEEYLEKILTHVTMFGAICLAGIAIVPQMGNNLFNVSYLVRGFFGGTGLLITVGVALDLMSKVESNLLMHNYEGFLKKGRLKGRRG
ncbi:MAG: preprotein translocase subunit SecY [Candidatus Brocadiia bacterium]